MGVTDAELLARLQDPLFFIEVFMKKNLSQKQKDFISGTSVHKHNLAIWSRQTGKSTVMSCYAIWRLLFGPGADIHGEHFKEHIVVLAPIMEQIHNVYDKIRNEIDKNQYISSFIIKANMHEIIARNGNHMTFMSASPGSKIRGETATCIMIDESQDIGDNKYYADIIPFGATTNASIIEAGTPKTKNHFFLTMNSGSVNVVKQMWFECPFIDKEFVMRQKANSPESLWRQEFLCEFIEEGVLAFPSWLFDPEVNDTGQPTGRWNVKEYPYISKLSQFTKEYRDIISKTLEDYAVYTIGNDLGKEQDNTVISVWRTDVRPVKMMSEIVCPLGTPYTEVAKIIAFLHRTFQPVDYNFDYSNEKGFIDTLRDNGVPAVIDPKQKKGAIVFNARNKHGMANNVRMLLENYQVALPKKADKLLQQFMNQQYEVNDTGQYKYYHPTNEYDDRLWAALLALKNVGLAKVEDQINFVNPWQAYDEKVHSKSERSVYKTNQNYLKRARFFREDMKRRVGMSNPVFGR